uniref:NADH dehydrogenase subunit 5 n=1 Tax=Platygaster robiniae TaxID=2753657 RepID=UPI00211483D2|nr:NADH dehydrogenase subunit 5 [Platygaster robiniae]UTI38871.1 NADH dehydrogenase subunit 5 [Platygaster robiniae]
MCLFYYFNTSMFLFMNFMVMFFMFIYFLIFNIKFYLEVNLISFMGMNPSLMFYFDYKSIMFMGVVLLISSMVVMYSVEYMMLDMYKIRFLILLSLFVFSMLMMIVGQNLLMILLGWDGLGLISYCLVIYYNSWSSFNAGMLTLLTNRLGDIGLLISISLISFLGSWNYLMYSYSSLLLMFMMMMAFITKSAQLPFSSWLPAAMAAPTPISSLVHSSTLVTAGIYLLIRFYEFLLVNVFFKNLLMLMGLMTMFMAGLIANVENDFKKIIALSTLSQLGMMMMTLCLSLKLMSFFHLIVHALFKSLLFMCAGLILHVMVNNQDIRYMGSMNINFMITLLYFNCSNMALCGYPFMSGFFSKDLILEILLTKSINYLVLFLFYLSIGLTVMYTFRLLFYMNFLVIKSFVFMSFGDDMLMNSSMFILFVSSIISGMYLSNFLFSMMIYSFLSVQMKLLIFLIVMKGMIIGIMINYIHKNFFFPFKIFVDMIIYMKFMFGVSMMIYYLKLLSILMKNLFSYMEKGWLNFYSVSVLTLLFKTFSFSYFYISMLNILLILLIFIILV